MGLGILWPKVNRVTYWTLFELQAQCAFWHAETQRELLRLRSESFRQTLFWMESGGRKKVGNFPFKFESLLFWSMKGDCMLLLEIANWRKLLRFVFSASTAPRTLLVLSNQTWYRTGKSNKSNFLPSVVKCCSKQDRYFFALTKNLMVFSLLTQE